MKNIITKKTIIQLSLIWLVVLLFMVFTKEIEAAYSNPLAAVGIFLLVLLTILAAAFAVVKEADELANMLGEPYGTLILTLSIVSIEVILIAAMMFGPTENPTIGKDSIFSVMMIILNLVMGLCILLGGLKYVEQAYNAQGTLTYLSMIIVLGGISMILPNFISGQGNGEFSTIQAISISGVIVLLYGYFLAFQIKGYNHLYMQPAHGKMEISLEEKTIHIPRKKSDDSNHSKNEVLIRSILLLAMILPIVLLSHHLATLVDHGIQELKLPTVLGGVLIALIVFTPESMTAVKAALQNEFQRAINLCLGAFVSTVGLTVPAVLIIGLIAGKTVQFGMTATETILFVLTLIISMLSFSGRKTVPILGLIHLVLFFVFTVLIFHP